MRIFVSGSHKRARLSGIMVTYGLVYFVSVCLSAVYSSCIIQNCSLEPCVHLYVRCACTM